MGLMYGKYVCYMQYVSERATKPPVLFQPYLHDIGYVQGRRNRGGGGGGGGGTGARAPPSLQHRGQGPP